MQVTPLALSVKVLSASNGHHVGEGLVEVLGKLESAILVRRDHKAAPKILEARD